MIFRFVDIGGIIDYHCLKFLFIIPINMCLKIRVFPNQESQMNIEVDHHNKCELDIF